MPTRIVSSHMRLRAALTHACFTRAPSFAPSPRAPRPRLPSAMAEKRGSIRSFFTPAAKKTKKDDADETTEDAIAPLRPSNVVNADAGADAKEGGSTLTDAQRKRVELNKQLARSKAAQREATKIAEVAAANGVAPNIEDLLVESTWREILEPEFKKEYFGNLKTFLKREWSSGAKVFPATKNVFRAFNSCATANVKVVILGQDPYHDDGQAMGLSFSVPKGIKVPSSLSNIYKELGDDLGCKKPTHGDLDKWATQGVLMLNASLTVRAHQANSHSKKGWEVFTDAAIRSLSKKQTNLVFMLWGKNAQEKERLIAKDGNHLVLKCPHPSGLSAHRGFYGCKHFSQANAYIEKKGGVPIDWQIE